MLIYIVRHGETEWNKQRKTQGTQNISLTDKGRQQADRLGKRLEGKSICCIYSSDLNRAFETAAIIGAKINLVPIPSPLLREVCFGAWEGLTLEEIERKYPGQLETWNKNMNYCPPNGESINSVRTRVRNFIQILKENHINEDERILVVSHALTCKILILELLDISIEYINHIRLDNSSLSLVQYSEQNRRIFLMNDTCHI